MVGFHSSQKCCVQVELIGVGSCHCLGEALTAVVSLAVAYMAYGIFSWTLTPLSCFCLPHLVQLCFAAGAVVPLAPPLADNDLPVACLRVCGFFEGELPLTCSTTVGACLLPSPHICCPCSDTASLRCTFLASSRASLASSCRCSDRATSLMPTTMRSRSISSFCVP